MTKATYVPVRSLTRKHILDNLSRSDPQEIRETLISLSYWEDDRSGRSANFLLIRNAKVN